MSYLQPPELHQQQADVLIENLDINPLLPKSPILALNKGLNTSRQNIIQAINELLNSQNTMQESVAVTINQQNEVIGDYTGDPTLLEQLHNIDNSVIGAIIKLHNEIQTLKQHNRYDDYAQEFSVTDGPITEFTLKYKPCSPIQLFVNGLMYETDCWTYDKASNKITWTYTEEQGGFNLIDGFSISVIYDFLYSENEVVNPENP